MVNQHSENPSSDGLIENRPGLPALSYRAGTYATIVQRMLENLHKRTVTAEDGSNIAPLENLNIFAENDLSVSLLKSWAMVSDVLTFYQERIANECYIRTANEPFSLLELTHSIGYRPNPGVSASAHLAFTVADLPGTPDVVTVPKGTPIQSVPGQDELPQVFETSEDIQAKAEWNAIVPYRPPKTVPEQVSANSRRARIAGTTGLFNPGDLIVFREQEQVGSNTPARWYLRSIKAAEPRPDTGYTMVTWESTVSDDDDTEPLVNPDAFTFAQQGHLFGYDAPYWDDAPDDVKINYSGREGGIFGYDAQDDLWQNITANLPNDDIQSMLVADNGSIFIGTVSEGIFRSQDGGVTWKQINIGLVQLNIYCMASDRLGALFAGTPSGVFRSADNGSTWEVIPGGYRLEGRIRPRPIATDLPDTAIRSLLPHREPGSGKFMLFAGTDYGVFRTFNDGNGWMPMNDGLPDVDDDTGFAPVVINAFAPDRGSGDIYIGTSQGLYYSTNEGRRWRPLNDDFNTIGINASEYEQSLLDRLLRRTGDSEDSAQPRVITSLVIHSNDEGRPDIFANTNVGLYRLSDRGRIWAHLDERLLDAITDNRPEDISIRSITSYVESQGDARYLVAATDAGVLRSPDGGNSWESVSQGLNSDDIKFLASNTQGQLLAITPITGWIEKDWPNFGIQGNVLDIDSAVGRVLPDSLILLRRISGEDNQLYQVARSRNITRRDYGLSRTIIRVELRATDGLDTFDVRDTEVYFQSQIWPLFNQQVLENLPIEGDELKLDGIVSGLEAGQPVIVTGKRMRARVLDAGGALMLTSEGWQRFGMSNMDIRALIVTFNGEIMAGTSGQGVFTYPDIRAIRGNLHRWGPTNVQPSNPDIRALVMDNEGTIYAGTNGGGIFFTLDNGGNWRSCNGTDTGVLRNLDVQALAVNSSRHIFAGTKGGVFRSTRTGRQASWRPVNSGLTTPDVRALAINSEGHIFAGTHGGGVFMSTDQGENWVAINQRLTNLDIRALVINSDGAVFAGTSGGGVFVWIPGENRWREMVTGLSNKDVRALALMPTGELLAGTRGDGVFRTNGPRGRWQHIPTGLSNDVRALSSRRTQGQILTLAGTRDVAVLTSEDGLATLDLERRDLFSISSTEEDDIEQALDQGEIPDPMLKEFENDAIAITDDVTVTPLEMPTIVVRLGEGTELTVEEGRDRWLIEDVDNKLYVARRDRNQIAVFDAPDTLVVVASPTEIMDGKMQRWSLMNKLGFVGHLMAMPDEVIIVPPSESDEDFSEVCQVFSTRIFAEDDYTVVGLGSKLSNTYDPRATRVNANVALATHGETLVNEVLGSGAGEKVNQRFILSRANLSYVPAETPTGGESTLEVKIISGPQQGVMPGMASIPGVTQQGETWKYTPSLFNAGPHEHVYTTRVAEENKTQIIFGDGKKGARLPSGTENVVANYRSGIGIEGNVNPNTISSPRRQPLGILSVTNPVSASGAADPEPMDTAQTKAPVTTRSLDRIVSLKDYEDYISTLPGVGKVQVKSLWNGKSHIAHITIAGVDGASIETDSALYRNIVRSVTRYKASPHHQMRIEPYAPIYFNVEAAVFVDPDFETDPVRAEVESILTQKFSFTSRSFGQDVTASDVIATIVQNVSHIQHVDLHALYTVGFTRSLESNLTAYPANWDGVNNDSWPAQLLMINTNGGILLNVESADE